MQFKFIALVNSGTWKLIDLLSNVKTTGCMWVYKIKHGENEAKRD